MIEQIDPKEMLDKELQDLIEKFVKMLQEKHYDYLLVFGERATKKDISGERPRMGMSAICSESEVPVLPSILMGTCTRSQTHQRFVEDLLNFFMRMGRKMTRTPKKESDEKYYN